MARWDAEPNGDQGHHHGFQRTGNPAGQVEQQRAADGIEDGNADAGRLQRDTSHPVDAREQIQGERREALEEIRVRHLSLEHPLRLVQEVTLVGAADGGRIGGQVRKRQRCDQHGQPVVEEETGRANRGGTAAIGFRIPRAQTGKELPHRAADSGGSHRRTALRAGALRATGQRPG
jgi:hypothetical protein